MTTRKPVTKAKNASSDKSATAPKSPKSPDATLESERTDKITSPKRSKAATAKKSVDKKSAAPTHSSNESSEQAPTHTGPALSIPEGLSNDIAPVNLLLDPQNLRLLERTGSNDSLSLELFGQITVQQKLYDIIKDDPRFDIRALAESIANNGFLKHERLIVARFDGNKFLVLEGNRRLTAVRSLFEKHGPRLEGLSSYVRDTLVTLPCFILEGSAIDGDAERLKKYRRAAEIYIGMRHLMGAKNWEPASRYEFQSRLIQEEGWSVSDIAIRFGRKTSEVIRDFQAHLLYQGFLKFEKKMGVSHSLTYNSFSEAARASAIREWLGWDKEEGKFTAKENQDIFFKYLISRLGKPASGLDLEGYEATEVPEISAEAAVRKLRDMLKLNDPLVEEALQDSNFNSAEILYEERKEGELSKKITSFIRMLRRTSTEELTESPDVAEKFRELQLFIEKSLKVITVLTEK